MAAVTELTWPQVHAWRLQRQFAVTSAVDAARRLCGVQAQVTSAAELAVAVRLDAQPRARAAAAPGGPADTLAAALARGDLLRTWAMRGTLHVLHPQDAAAFLALVAAARTWAKGSWQKTFLTLGQVDALAAAVTDLLADGVPRTREQLVAHVRDTTAGQELADHVASSWGAALKPLAWQGILCNGPTEGNAVTFTRPDIACPGWPGLMPLDDAGRHAIRRYLAAFGPADPATFDAWLLRGATSKPVLRQWFADLDDELAPVDVAGRRLLARAQDVPALAATDPAASGHAVRLLPAFDQFVLGPGTSQAESVPPAHRGEVSRAAGWIAPVVATADGVVGTWRAEAGRITVSLFTDRPAPATRELAREMTRVEALL